MPALASDANRPRRARSGLSAREDQPAQPMAGTGRPADQCTPLPSPAVPPGDTTPLQPLTPEEA